MHIFLMENNKRPLCIIRVTAALEGCTRLPRERNVLIATHVPAGTCFGIYPKSCSFIAKIGSNQDVL